MTMIDDYINPQDNALVQRAARLAEYAHRDQRRDWTGAPYFRHVEEVATVLWMVGQPAVVVAAGYLHDTLEDTALDPTVIALETSEDVLRYVREVTNPADKDKFPESTRAERRAMNTSHLFNASWQGKTLKLADILANCRDVRRHSRFGTAYIEEKLEYLRLVPGGHSKLRQYVYSFILGEPV